MKKRTRMFMLGVMEWSYNLDSLKVKNVIFRKIKSGQFVVYSPLEFSEAVTKFVSSIHAVWLPENENIVEPEDISRLERTIKH